MAPAAFSWMSPTLRCFCLLLQQDDSLRRKTKNFFLIKAQYCKMVSKGKSFFMSSANCQTAENIAFLCQCFVPSWGDCLMGTMLYFPLDPTA